MNISSEYEKDDKLLTITMKNCSFIGKNIKLIQPFQIIHPKDSNSPAELEPFAAFDYTIDEQKIMKSSSLQTELEEFCGENLNNLESFPLRVSTKYNIYDILLNEYEDADEDTDATVSTGVNDHFNKINDIEYPYFDAYLCDVDSNTNNIIKTFESEQEFQIIDVITEIFCGKQSIYSSITFESRIYFKCCIPDSDMNFVVPIDAIKGKNDETTSHPFDDPPLFSFTNEDFLNFKKNYQNEINFSQDDSEKVSKITEFINKFNNC